MNVQKKLANLLIKQQCIERNLNKSTNHEVCDSIKIEEEDEKLD